MTGKKKNIAMASSLGLVFSLIIAAIVWLFGVIFLTPLWVVAVEIATFIVVTVLLSWLVYLYLRRPKVDEGEKQKKDWRDRIVSTRLAQVQKKHSRLSTNPYFVPWYVHLSPSIPEEQLWLQQMGFESIESSEPVPDDLLALRFWVSDDAVLISLDLSYEQEVVVASLEALYKHVLKKRPRQAFNGVICSVSLNSLINQSEIGVSDLSQRYRTILADLNTRTGLALPAYCLFTQMSSVRDFCELFSTLDESEREKAFGSLHALSDGSGYEKTWFDSSFDDLLARLSVTLSESLKRQLNADYRESSVSGVFQLSALRYDIEDFLSLTFSQHQFDDIELKFRGYFFINAGGETTSTDILTFMHASDLGFESLEGAHGKTTSLSLFSKSVFKHYIVKEASLVGVHKKKEWRYRTAKLCVSVGLLSLFAGFVWLLKANYDYQSTIDNKALVMLERYKDNLKHDVIVRDDLSSPIFSLSELREINELYKTEQQPWYVSKWLPDSGIEKYVSKSYHFELNDVLLTLMRDYILKDMFVYNSLDDKVKTLELLNLHQILYNPNRADVTALTHYYISELEEEGEGDADLVDRFKLLAQDVLNSGAVPPAADSELLTLVRSSLSSQDLSELLYQHILQHPEFARRIDVREQLNPSFTEVFTFKPGFTGYLVPYLFTRRGFEDLYAETGFELATEAIQAYEGVMGRISGDAELNRINRQLRERYITDYIHYWKDITSNVTWTSVSSWGDSQIQLELVTDAVFSPITQFYSLVNTHTNLASKGPEETDKEETQKSTDESDENANDASLNSTIARTAASISAPFLTLHKLVEPNKEGQTRLDIALNKLGQTQDWVAKSKEITSRGRYFLEQLTNADSSNVLAQLEGVSDDYSDPILPFLLKGQARTINRLALNEMRSVINDDWTVLSNYYQQRFSGRYPFDRSSIYDTSLADFEDYFKQGGMLDLFHNKYSVYFEQVGSNSTLLKGFIPHQYASLSSRYSPFLETAKRFQSGLFIKDKVGFEFFIRAEQMSPNLTRFGLESGARLFEYQNGPLFWQEQSWPIPSNQTQDIFIVTTDKKGSGTREKAVGEWSWFRIASLMKGATMVGTDDVSWRYVFGDSYTNLRIKSKSGSQPFSPRFFEGATPPTVL
ncbi:type VI secretion protein IcmF/TssM N-terminal domain-containing protein [Marinomonas mediterranea]|uniref:ImcF domain protein n=1 Tax=Marinomonas mediterranea (strain ATCC 700492 / JCM 21426 / NBRC 103028 / MMB-1) TaxID=717774 RepID=F2K2M3_MARM1|nr:type VI secretion protein IcmF/TssM N-terminal domain-containing protein [Marinomonas mediterranea]ADZ90068.1 ImcF domain protein [Marinomonas mediterranea MMB-1]WCN16273.1 type VI secretion system membrane subunit TssM [Marinomonas mediterranea MMB-1]